MRSKIDQLANKMVTPNHPQLARATNCTSHLEYWVKEMDRPITHRYSGVFKQIEEFMLIASQVLMGDN